MPRSSPVSRSAAGRVRALAFRAALGAGTACVLQAAEVGEFTMPPVLPLSPSQLALLRRLVAEDPEASALAEEARAAALPLLEAVPHPLAAIHYEGLVHTDPQRIATVAQLREMADVAAVVRHWQASDDGQAVPMLGRFVAAWAATYRPDGNDVNENKLLPLLVAYHGLRSGFPEERRDPVDTWVEALGTLHLRAVEASTRFTNRYAKHVRLLAVCGGILGRPEWSQHAASGVRRFVEQALHADGTSEDFRVRDTLTYHASALRPILELALLSGPEGLASYGWTNTRGGSLRKSVEFVVPFAMGERTRAEWVHSKVALDRRRAEAGLEEYRVGKPYDPASALELMELASGFDPALIRVVRHLTGTRAQRFPTWQCLVNAAALGGSPGQPDIPQP